jgi:hypothetical protein
MRSVFTRRVAVLFGLAAALIICRLEPVSGDDSRAKNVVVITLDGFRWQEMFTGASREYFKRENGEPGAAEKRFWRPTAEERRSALLPFIWSVVAARGQIFGDPSQQSLSHVTNGLWFSYPGYSEMFSGSADPRIDSNEKKPNPNVTVLEWLNTRPGFRGRVAAFGAWDVLPSILNVDRSGISVGSGFDLVQGEKNDRGRAINQLASDLPALWGYGPFDAPVVYAALESLRISHPRVMYIMLGETDEWAHRADYEMYLDAAYRADRFISRVKGSAADILGLRGQDDTAADHRSRTRSGPRRLDEPRPRGAGGRVYVDCGVGARSAARWGAQSDCSDDVAARRDDRGTVGRRLPGRET